MTQITRAEYNEWIKEECREFLELIGMKDINYLHGGLNERKAFTITIMDTHLAIIGEGRVGVDFHDNDSITLEESVALAYADWKGEDTQFQIEEEEILPLHELKVGDIVHIETSSIFRNETYEFLGFTGYMTTVPYCCAAFRELRTGTIRIFHNNPKYSHGKVFKPSINYAEGYTSHIENEEEEAD